MISTTNHRIMHNKTHNALSYHRTTEAITSILMDIWFIRSNANWVDIISKALPPHKYLLLLRQMLIQWEVVKDVKEGHGSQE